MRHQLSLAVAVGAIALSACFSPPRPALPIAECSFDSDCPGGEVCGPSGQCGAQCALDRDCDLPRTCQSGACAMPAGKCQLDGDCAPEQACGFNFTCVNRCASTAQCADGEACLNGLCLSLAEGNAECIRDSDCGVGKICTVAGSCANECVNDGDCDAPKTCGGGACVLPAGRCVLDGDCASTEACGFNGACTPRCTSTTQCQSGQVCLSGMCLEQAPSECSRNSDCSNGQACVEGRCAVACIDDRDCTVSSTCSGGFCTPAVPECITAANCGASEACSPQGKCVSSCTSGSQCSAAAGEVCSAGACVVSNAGTATIAGQVRFTGLGDHSGVTLSLRGPSTVSVTTDASGDYSLAGLTAGRYLLVATASSSAEGRIEHDLAAPPGVTTSAPRIDFAPVGELRGVAQLAGRTDHTGIQVFVTGTSVGAATDAAGNFAIKGVPIGSRDIVATYVGFSPTGASGLAVAKGQVTNVTGTLTLQTPPNTSGSFAFSSTPPMVAYLGRPYLYTAQAGGAGVASVSYSVAAGPAGFTIDPTSGVVSFQPVPAADGPHTVAIAANGGGPIAYQVYTLDVIPPLQELLQSTYYDLDENGGVTWAAGTGGLIAFSGATRTDVSPETGRRTGAIGSIEVANGGAVTGLQVPGGTISSLSGAWGPLSATWPGGTLSGATPIDLLTVASVDNRGGVFGPGVTVVNSDVIAAVDYVHGTVEAFSDNRRTPTALRTDTGVATAVAATVLTDANANWTADLSAKCLASPEGGKLDIASNTPTELTINTTDLTFDFWPGRRYFIVDCVSGSATFVLEDTGATFGALANRKVDLYLPGQSLGGANVGNYSILAGNTATQISFVAPVSLYSTLSSLPGQGGYYLIAETNNLLAITLTDSTQALGASLGTSSALALGNTFNYAIVGNTPTTITFSVALGKAHDLAPGGPWRLTDKTSAWNTFVTVTLAAGALGTAPATPHLYFDETGARFFATATTASTVTVRVTSSSFDVAGWVGMKVALVSGSTGMPTLRLEDSVGGLVAGRWDGLGLYRLTGAAGGFTLEGTILSASGNQLVLQPGTCSVNCGFAITGPPQRLPGASYTVGAASQGRLIVGLSAGGLVEDALVGRTVALVSSPGRKARVIANTADQLELELAAGDYDAYRALIPGSILWVSRITGASPTWRLRATDSAGTLTPGAFAEHFLVTPDGLVSGRVLTNDAGTLELSGDTLALARVVPGLQYALAQPVAVAGCSSSVGWIPVTVTLGGASLTADTYDTLTLTSVSYEVVSNDASSALVRVCPNLFDTLLSRQGWLGSLSRAGRVAITLHDSSASFTPGAWEGHTVAVLGASSQPVIEEQVGPVLANTATSVTFEETASRWQAIYADFAAGKKFLLTEPSGLVRVTASTSLSLSPGELSGRMVSLLSGASGLRVAALVDSHGPSTLELLIDDDEADALQFTASSYDHLLTSTGAVFKLTDPGASFVPGELVGRALYLNFSAFEVIANTANEVWAAIGLTGNLPLVFGATGYSIDGLGNPRAVAAFPDGSAIVLGGVNGTLFRVTPAGALTEVYTPLSTGRKLVVSAKPAPRLTLTGTLVDGDNTTVTVAEPLPPGAYAGGLLRAYLGNAWRDFPILSNTDRTLLVGDNEFLPVGLPLVVEDYRLEVQGGGLTPGELANRTLRVNGTSYRVRSNTATEIALAPYRFAVDRKLPSPAVGATEAWVLSGLDPRAPTDLEVASGGGFYAAHDLQVTHYDGASWRNYTDLDTATVVTTGTVTGLQNGEVYDANASYAPGELAGKWLRLSTGEYRITSNTANLIDLNGSFSSGAGTSLQVLWPAIGEGYEVIEPDGLLDAVESISEAGGTLYVANGGNGLFKLSGGAWTRLTVANTETAPGAYDGMPYDWPTSVEAVSASEFWLAFDSYYVAHFDGAAWHQYSPDNTESTPGAWDGLHDSGVERVHLEQDEVWFLSNDGASVWRGGTTWEQYSGREGIFARIWDVEVTSGGEILFAGEYPVGLSKAVP